jgi:hypothetical protein
LEGQISVVASVVQLNRVESGCAPLDVSVGDIFFSTRGVTDHLQLNRPRNIVASYNRQRVKLVNLFLCHKNLNLLKSEGSAMASPSSDFLYEGAGTIWGTGALPLAEPPLVAPKN